MGFKLRSTISRLLGINEELSSYTHPVFEKNLEGGVVAEANRDGTTFVNKKASKSKKKEAIDHENVHHEQMRRGDLNYDENNVYWKGKTYPRGPQMNEGAKGLPWEAEAYNRTK